MDPWERVSRDIEKGIDRTLAVVAGVVVLVFAAVVDVMRHRHSVKR